MRRVLLIGLSMLAACGGATLAKREPDEYAGCATDENWPLFDENADLVDDAQAPLVTSPHDGASVPITPVDIDWQVTPTEAGDVEGDIPTSCAQWSTGYTTLHLPPVSGTVYDLQLIAGGQIKHRVLTSLQKWTASADTWEKLAGDTIELHVVRIEVENGDLQAGPFAPTTSPRVTIAK